MSVSEMQHTEGAGPLMDKDREGGKGEREREGERGREQSWLTSTSLGSLVKQTGTSGPKGLNPALRRSKFGKSPNCLGSS